MKTGYKISLLLALLVSVLMVSLNKSADILQAPLGMLVTGSLFFVILGFGFSGAYYCISNKRTPYTALLIASVLLTAFLFYMDYTVWDTIPTPTATQIVRESLFVGPIYVSLFFGLFAGTYHLVLGVSRLMKRMIKA